MTTRTKPSVPVNYAELLSKESADIAKRIAAPSGDRIYIQNNSIFKTPDGQEGEALQVVVVEFISSNMMYDRAYDKNNPSPPACFAIGPEPSTLVPSTNSPSVQAGTCSACPNNQFGSAANGKGKACKNTRLLAVMPLWELDDPNNEAPIWIMSVPPASIKAFDGYAHSLAAKHKTVPIGVITEISLDTSSAFASPRFDVVRPLTNDELGFFVTRREEASQRLYVEPDVSQYAPPQPVKNVRRPVR